MLAPSAAKIAFVPPEALTAVPFSWSATRS
jgi:hypothetical protein